MTARFFPLDYGDSSLEVRKRFPWSTVIFPFEFGLFPSEYGAFPLGYGGLLPGTTVKFPFRYGVKLTGARDLCY